MRNLLLVLVAMFAGLAHTQAQDKPRTRVYQNRLTPLREPAPLLADYPDYVEPIRTGPRFEAPMLIDDADADLEVRGWRFSYNARGIVEVPNRLAAKATAIVVVHPWGIDDGQGWKSPEPAGAAFHCTPFKNGLTLRHMKDVIDPFLKVGRSRVAVVAYSLPGTADPIRKKMYRSVNHEPTADERKQGAQELAAKLRGFAYRGQPVPEKIVVSTDKPMVDYFKQFAGLDATAKFNNAGFWDLPIPVAKPIDVAARDVVFYDGDGYVVLRDFLRKHGVRHVLLAGYSTDMCVCSTTAGYKNLSKDFNVFLGGDATLATFPAHDTPRFATSAALAFASLDLFITQVSWVRWKSVRQPLLEKPEIRNPKQIRNSEARNPKQNPKCKIRNAGKSAFRISCFEVVSDFGLYSPAINFLRRSRSAG
jgi:nicotinamidase-related amidase